MRLLLLLLVAPAPLSRAQTPQPLPEAPQPAPQLIVRDPNAPRPLQPVIVNGRPYMRPTQRQYFVDYLRDSYGFPALARSTVRTLYNEGLGQPGGWGQDFPGFM